MVLHAFPELLLVVSFEHPTAFTFDSLLHPSPFGLPGRQLASWPAGFGECLEASSLRIYLTGEVQVENGGRLLGESQLGGPQGRVVLAYLVTERKRAVTQAEIAEALWPESLPASWTLALSAIVSKLRSRLAGVGLPRSHIIGNAFGCYQLTPPEETWVDIEAALAGVDAAEGALASGNAQAAYGPSL